MKVKNLLKLFAIALLSMTMVYSSCEKEDDADPTPTPVAYTPIFDLTYLTVPVGGTDYLDFAITCTSDNWEMISVAVSAPGGLGNETYAGNGQIQLRGAPFTFSDIFVKLGGSWSFTIVGNIKSGDHVGESFTVVKSVSISGKK